MGSKKNFPPIYFLPLLNTRKHSAHNIMNKNQKTLSHIPRIFHSYFHIQSISFQPDIIGRKFSIKKAPEGALKIASIFTSLYATATISSSTLRPTVERKTNKRPIVKTMPIPKVIIQF